MLRINCTIPPTFLQGIVQVLETYIPAIIDRQPDALDHDWLDSEDEMVDIWIEGLRDALREDCACLLQLVKLPEFGKGVCSLEEEQVDPVLRSISAVRLFLRGTALAEISDQQLEQGDLALHLIPEQRRFYLAVYIFLAGLQELLLRQLS